MPSLSHRKQKKKETEPIMQASGGVDLISNLPDDILHQILSFLPMKSLVRTSILSTRWRYLWTFTSNLVFSYDVDHFGPPEIYVGIINRCMQLHKATKIQTLDIHLPIDPDYFANGEEWILFAAARQVEELNLRRLSLLGRPDSLPNSLFHCKTLSVLKLNCFILSIPSDFDGFKSLKTLCLSDVSFKTEQIRTLLSACPFIENLEIWGPYEDEYGEDLEISIESQHLKKLVLSSFVYLRKLEIDAPNLLFFEFGVLILPRLSMKNTSHCLKVKLSFEREVLLYDGELSKLEDWENMVQYIAHTENFTLGEYNDSFLWYGLYCSQRFTFTNLKELHWYGDFIEPCFLVALVTFIQDCPALEKVCLDIQITLRTVVHEDSKSEIPAYTPLEKSLLKEQWLPLLEDPNYSLQHLKTVKIMGFSGNWIQMQLLKFLLDKAVLLNLLLVIFPQKKKISKRLIWKQLTSWPKASSHAQILLSDFSKVYTCPTHLPQPYCL